MLKFLIAMLSMQVNPVPTGIASGVVLSSTGMPASGVRVFAVPAGTSDAVSVNATVFDALTQTDSSGRYRLAIPPGRYYIGAGSVNSPTYYPNTTNISSAKAIVVSADSTLEDINFSQYIAPALGILNGAPPLPLVTLPPGSTGVLSGVIRSADGSPAAGVPVLAVPSSVSRSVIANSPAKPRIMFQPPGNSAAGSLSLRSNGVLVGVYSDNQGQFRFESVSPETYLILAGYSDSPVFYPGTGDIQMATSITTTPTTLLDKLDLVLPASTGTTSIQGSVLGVAGKPLNGAQIALTPSSSNAIGLGTLLPTALNTEVHSDGTYRFDRIAPGSYKITAQSPCCAGYLSKSRNIVVKSEPFTADFDFQINVVNGKVLWEDGSPLNEPAINRVAMRTNTEYGVTLTDYIPVSKDGDFSKAMPVGDYRVFLNSLFNEVGVASITANGADITNSSLRFNGKDPVEVQVRLTRTRKSGTKVSGTILDVATGKPPASDRIALCCFNSGPFERISTMLKSDGTFEFVPVPEGSFKFEFESPSTLIAVGEPIEVGASEIRDLGIVSTARIDGIRIQTAVDGAETFPPSPNIKVTWTAVSSGVGVTTFASSEVRIWYLPAGTPFELTVSEIPSDLKIKSITSDGKLLATDPAQRIVTTATSILITLEPKTR